MSGRGRGRALTVGLVAMCGWLLHAAGSSHSGALSRFEYSQLHMGMPVRIVFYAPSSVSGAMRASQAACQTARRWQKPATAPVGPASRSIATARLYDSTPA